MRPHAVNAGVDDAIEHSWLLRDVEHVDNIASGGGLEHGGRDTLKLGHLDAEADDRLAGRGCRRR